MSLYFPNDFTLRGTVKTTDLLLIHNIDTGETQKTTVGALLSSLVVGNTTISTASVALTANLDYLYDTGSATKPKMIQVIDASGSPLSWVRSFSSTYKITIYSTESNQNVEISIIY